MMYTGIVTFSKNMAVSERIVVEVIYYCEVLSEYAKRSGVQEKVKFRNFNH